MSPPELDSLIAGFTELAASGGGEGGVLPRAWDKTDWGRLFEGADLRRVRAGDALIRRGDSERTLFFVLRGSLEVISHVGAGALIKADAGSVVGEMSFFDELPRSASVWAVADSEVAAVTIEQFTEFESQYPRLARDLLFALGRALATRLRRLNARLDGNG